MSCKLLIVNVAAVCRGTWGVRPVDCEVMCFLGVLPKNPIDKQASGEPHVFIVCSG